MDEPILKSVAMPPRFLWAPQVPAIANFAVQMVFCLLSIGIFDTNPLLFLITIVIGHVCLIGIGMKEPHLSNMLKSRGPFIKRYRSIYHLPGTKLAP